MGRRKKIVEIKEIGQIEANTNNLINDLRAKEKKDSKQIDEDKSFKKWEKLIIKTYFEKLKISYTELNQKLEEKYLQEEEVKSIISELKIKIKEFEYLVKKQWQILKKFNLQEKIYREESKNLADSESSKRNEIFKDAIEKLTAAHVRGFEPASILKNKILNKIQIKFEISDIVMKDLSNIFCKAKYFEEEENLLKLRYQDQVKVLERFVKSNALVNNNMAIFASNSFYSNYDNNKSNVSSSNFFNINSNRDKDLDYYNIYHQNKQELKRYEKELEMKAGKGAFLIEEKDENMEDIFINQDGDNYTNDLIPNSNVINDVNMKNNDSSNTPNVAIKKASSSSILVLEREKNQEENRSTRIVSDNISLGQADMEFSEKYFRYNPNIKVKDVLKVSDADQISKFKEKIVEDFISRINKENNTIFHNNTQNLGDTLNFSLASPPKKTFYKSKILNDLFIKLSTFNKLTDFDLQILIYLSHVVVRDLVYAKLESKSYEGIVHPEELLDFLKRFKIDIQNNYLSIDGRQIESLNGNFNNNTNNFSRNNPGNNSSYSHIQSHHSNFSELTSEF